MKFMPFSDFYFIFKLIFPFQNRRKNVYLPPSADVVM